ncbi:uncharacterized protein LOC100706737 [Oreochromis niloticus]|uniref:uncharacterized protein LOC100706737 n=1 Tax=Oreochromis niloticus TaxID=8128 RepID=UPI000393F190|nr:uncharacterized protein LOC100706737 [Oreochromis niloticus]
MIASNLLYIKRWTLMPGRKNILVADRKMSSFQFSLRRFITERLAAVADEISSEVEKRILQYQKEISSHQLLKVTRKPEIRGHIIDLTQHDSKEEEDLGFQQLRDQKGNSSRHQEDPEPPQIIQDKEELCTNQEREQPVLKQDKGIVVWTEEWQLRLLENIWKPELNLHRTDPPQERVCKEKMGPHVQQLCNHELRSSLYQEKPKRPQMKKKQKELRTSQEGERFAVRQPTSTFMVTPTYKERDRRDEEQNCNQALSGKPPEPESRKKKKSKSVGSASSLNAELKKRKRDGNRSQSSRVENAPMSESQSKADASEKSAKCAVKKLFGVKLN